MSDDTKFKHCPFCKTEKRIESFQNTRSGNRVNKCNQCKYQEIKKIKSPRYVSLKERQKLKTERDQ